MTVFVVKMRNKSSGYVGNHSTWRNKADADRQSALRNKFHPDYEYWVEEDYGQPGKDWYNRTQVKLGSSVGWMVVL